MAYPGVMGSSFGAEGEVQRQQAVIQDLRTQVDMLQRKLGDLHATDINSIRRAYKSLAQHVQALDVETKHLTGLAAEVDASLLTPEAVAREAGFLSAAAGVTWTLTRMIRGLGLQSLDPLSRMVTATGVAVVVMRVLGVVGRDIGVMLARNQRAKQHLLQDMESLRQRIDIMLDLANSGLALHQLAAPAPTYALPAPQATPSLAPYPPTPPQPARVEPMSAGWKGWDAAEGGGHRTAQQRR